MVGSSRAGVCRRAGRPKAGRQMLWSSRAGICRRAGRPEAGRQVTKIVWKRKEGSGFDRGQLRVLRVASFLRVTRNTVQPAGLRPAGKCLGSSRAGVCLQTGRPKAGRHMVGISRAGVCRQAGRPEAGRQVSPGSPDNPQKVA